MVAKEQLDAVTRMCANVLSLNSQLCVKRGLWGKPKPSRQQIGWAAGFCDAATQALELDDVEVFSVMAVSFEAAFGKAGSKSLAMWLKDQTAFQDSMMQGGSAYLTWSNTGESPVMPFSE